MSYFGSTPIEIALNLSAQIVGIIAIVLFIRLISTRKGPDMHSWKILFYALLVFAIKKVVVGLSGTGIIFIPSTLFNVIIITMFIYALFVELEYRKHNVGVEDLTKINESLKRINDKL